MKSICLRGVRQNNLKNVDVDIPLGSFTVVCGPSGSGKSSLAFETLYSEGQRRYIESLSNYTKQFLNKAPKPDVESISNIPPAIALEQKNGVKSARSTVGTATEILDFLRLLFEKAGEVECPKHHIKLSKDSSVSGAEKVINQFKNERAYVLALILKKDRGINEKQLLKQLKAEGFLRIYVKSKKSKKKSSTTVVGKGRSKRKSRGVDKETLHYTQENFGEVLELNGELINKKGLPKTDFYLVIDRMTLNQENKSRVIDSISLAFQFSNRYKKKVSDSSAAVLTTGGLQMKLSEANSCPLCDHSFVDISSQLFSFNSPLGACESCKGFGNILSVDINKVILNQDMSLADGAITIFDMPSRKKDKKLFVEFCKKSNISLDIPWKNLTASQRKKIWEGTKKFDGVLGVFKKLERKKYKMHIRIFLSRYKSPQLCSTCEGSRLKEEALQVYIKGLHIDDYCRMTILEFKEAIEAIELSSEQKVVCKDVLDQLNSRLQFLIDSGVGYLTICRPTKTLSGGEYQRLSLSNQLGMGLSQTLYVLDEPTIGLHPRDSDRLIQLIQRLRVAGNTLVVVEHDLDVIKESTHIVEMGPGSGEQGGSIVFEGEYKKFLKSKESNTAFYLNPKKRTPLPIPRPVKLPECRYKLDLKGCVGNNLKDVNLILPLNRLVTVTGVSGSGKSSLLKQTLYPALARELGVEYLEGLPYKEIKGYQSLKNVLFIEQGLKGKSTRSSPVTYLKIFEFIRRIFASVEAAKEQGFRAGTFSLNINGGRCDFCQGLGYEVVDMMFMDDIHITCDACNGKKYKEKVLKIKYKGKSIYDVLNMTVTEAMDFFVSYPKIRSALSLLKRVGLGYICLGQASHSLSGGEGQRLKIAKELQNSGKKATLYILDEPTTGLHFKEINLLLEVLNQLVESGNSVVLIEHNLEVIKNSDFIIDIGPEAGEGGGEIVAQGSPEELIKISKSFTGHYLNSYLGLLSTSKSPLRTRKKVFQKKDNRFDRRL